jgi:cellulose synthase/poly-beta-1,6-N-acetylglucosamine synthase-like glycosyltransferase
MQIQLEGNVLLYIFFFFVLLQLVMSLESLRGGFRFRDYVSDHLSKEYPKFKGKVSIIVPCCGDEEGLNENLYAVMAQKRGSFEVIFVVADEGDEAVPLLKKITQEFENTKLVFAGESVACGQKVHNLLAAIANTDSESKAFVFVDSDARPSEEWLENIVSPLSEEAVGCSSGYRWFVQNRGGVATHLRTAWNASIASSLGANRKSNFAWGGSMALRRDLFEQLDVSAYWIGTLSDDFAITSIVKKAGYGVHFEPKCLTATLGDTGFRDLFEFTTRQMKITRVYSYRHFVISFIGAALFTFTFFPLIVLLFMLEGTWFWVSAFSIAVLLATGIGKSLIRLKTVMTCLVSHRGQLRKQLFWQAVLWPFSTVVFLLNDITAVLSREITWRGISYELVSSKETKRFKK